MESSLETKMEPDDYDGNHLEEFMMGMMMLLLMLLMMMKVDQLVV